ncbi:hypothetical protein [uncultured Capnocytophaga sp.]|uniref:hypothetical protein n=1 Tax=uncultured Capnocytophaga sp. TaxID=159273 RepID=UPI0028E6D20B|nr:hypothetical protein [uncultured Capnocytophaga sp.]
MSYTNKEQAVKVFKSWIEDYKRDFEKIKREKWGEIDLLKKSGINNPDNIILLKKQLLEICIGFIKKIENDFNIIERNKDIIADTIIFDRFIKELAEVRDLSYKEIEKIDLPVDVIDKGFNIYNVKKREKSPTPPPTNVLIPPVTNGQTKPAEQEPKKVVTEQPTKEVAQEPNKNSAPTSFSSEEKKETKETKPKVGFFTTTNIIILMILLGAGAYFYNQKK